MEDIREQMDLANEVSDAIAQPLGVDYDEDELNKELEDLEQETLNEKLSEIDDSKQRTCQDLNLLLDTFPDSLRSSRSRQFTANCRKSWWRRPTCACN